MGGINFRKFDGKMCFWPDSLRIRRIISVRKAFMPRIDFVFRVTRPRRVFAHRSPGLELGDLASGWCLLESPFAPLCPLIFRFRSARFVPNRSILSQLKVLEVMRSLFLFKRGGGRITVFLSELAEIDELILIIVQEARLISPVVAVSRPLALPAL